MENKRDAPAASPPPPPPPVMGAQAMAVVSGSFLSGAMVSLSAFVIPVLLDTNSDADHILRQWARLYHYGHIYLPALCVATCGLYGRAWALGGSHRRGQQSSRPRRVAAAAAVSTLAMVPLTWLFMAPTNNSLFRLGASEPGAAELGLVRGLVVRWAWLHVARSMFPLFGAFLGLTGLLRELSARP